MIDNRFHLMLECDDYGLPEDNLLENNVESNIFIQEVLFKVPLSKITLQKEF